MRRNDFEQLSRFWKSGEGWKEMMMVLKQDVEARLISAARVWLRFEAVVPAGWATDGPWRLSHDDAAARWERALGALEAGVAVGASAARVPLPDRDAITQAEEALGWLVWVPEGDRVLVADVVRRKARSGARGVWAGLADPAARGARSLAARKARYGRALAALACEMGRRGVVVRACIAG